MPSVYGKGPTIMGRSSRMARSGVSAMPSRVWAMIAGCLRTMSHAVENSSRRPSFAGCVIAACEKYERQNPWCHWAPSVSGSSR